MKPTEERLADRLEDLLQTRETLESDFEHAYCWSEVLSAEEVRGALREAIRRVIRPEVIERWEHGS